MKTITRRVQVGTGKFEPIRGVHFLEEEDAFEIVMDSGATYMLPHAELRRANGLKPQARAIESIWIDAETRSGFFVRYEDGSEAEASWERVVEQAKR